MFGCVKNKIGTFVMNRSNLIDNCESLFVSENNALLGSVCLFLLTKNNIFSHVINFYTGNLLGVPQTFLNTFIDVN